MMCAHISVCIVPRPKERGYCIKFFVKLLDGDGGMTYEVIE